MFDSCVLNGKYLPTNKVKPENKFNVPSAPVKFLNNGKNNFSLSQTVDFTKSSFNLSLSPILQTQDDSKLSNNTAHPTIGDVQLRSIQDIPRQFHRIFSFPYFNLLQSKVFDEVLYTEKSIVVSAPTGSGKTVVFELALIRLIMKAGSDKNRGKIIYMAPMKALCSERYADWQDKFSPQGLRCMEVTGDTEIDDIGQLMNASLILTTPEKWDSVSRRWKDNSQLFRQIKLFFIDEIHTLNDRTRGATIEAVISRMKILQAINSDSGECHIRFIAVSATMPNYSDIALWLSQPNEPAVAVSIGDHHRPVKLERIVLGYPYKDGTSDFRFDMNLSYRLKSIIDTYAHSKPTLVFCSSRKSVLQTAEILAKSRQIRVLGAFKSDLLQKAISSVHEHKLSELLQLGVGIHHAGLHLQDRQIVEELFKSSQLPVLISTSTLAMGVNLPAHLVIIKSTHFYNMGNVQEYSDIQILQMVGRAGRPQFDTFAVAVIMTKMSLKYKYESLVNGTQLIESSLHKHLIEHLNAEIVLQTICTTDQVLEWLKQTFLYVRALKNPTYYGFPHDLDTKGLEKKLIALCQQNLNQLITSKLVAVNDDTNVIFPMETGRLMARYCVAYRTITSFQQMAEQCPSMADMLTEFSCCSEFEDIQLRNNEKKILNTLNKDNHKETIRFPMSGKIKTGPMKVSCLIQAQLSCLTVTDFSLTQDLSKIFRVGQRVTKCLMEFCMLQGQCYSVVLYSILLYKAFKTKIWFDSRYVARQLDGIGPAMSLALANSGLTSFQKIEKANARDIELIVNRHPPFGNQVLEAISTLPKYQLAIEQGKPYKPHKAVLTLIIDLVNHQLLKLRPSFENSHHSVLIVGDMEDKLVTKWRINDSGILRYGSLKHTFEVTRCKKGKKLDINLLSLVWVGLDVVTDFEPIYTDDWFDIPKNLSTKKEESVLSKVKAVPDNHAGLLHTSEQREDQCNHRCYEKSLCGHKCCKTIKRSTSVKQGTRTTKKAKMNGSSSADNIQSDKCSSELTVKAAKSLVKPLLKNVTAQERFNGKLSTGDANFVKISDDVCFDLVNYDDLETCENFNKPIKKEQSVNSSSTSDLRASCKLPVNLDIAQNDWADLDAFVLCRATMYRNGRPPHLQEESGSVNEHFSPEKDLYYDDKTNSWLNSSSDEELCQLSEVDNCYERDLNKDEKLPSKGMMKGASNTNSEFAFANKESSLSPLIVNQSVNDETREVPRAHQTPDKSQCLLHSLAMRYSGKEKQIFTGTQLDHFLGCFNPQALKESRLDLRNMFVTHPNLQDDEQPRNLEMFDRLDLDFLCKNYTLF